MKYFLFLIILVTLAFLPTYFQEKQAPADTFYPKIHGIFEDYYSDLSVIKQGRKQWFYLNQYTTEESAPSRIHFAYLLMGRIAKFIGISEISIYYLAIFAALALFYLMSVKIVELVIKGNLRWFAVLLIFLAGPFPQGTQWWTYMDVYHRLILRPHHYLAVALLVGASYFTIKFLREKSWLYVVIIIILNTLATLFSFIPGFLYICAIVTAGFIMIIRQLINKKKLNKRIVLGFCWIIIASLIPFLYVRQQVNSTGFPWNLMYQIERSTFREEHFPYLFSVFVSSYGILLLGLPFFVLKIFRKVKFEQLFIGLLAILPLVFYYLSARSVLPITKIRFVYSAPYVFSGIVAVWGLEYALEKIKNSGWRKLIMSFVLMLLLANIVSGLWFYWWPELKSRNFYANIYIPKRYLNAVRFLNDNTPEYSNVISTFYSGVYIPAFSMNKVFVGHEASTYQFWPKFELAEKFFRGNMTNEEAAEILQKNNINYVFWDQGELPPEYGTLMEPVYNKEGITIFVIN